MPATYEPIATTTLSAAQANIEFTSIPGTYTDLVLVISHRVGTTGYSSYVQFNSDNGSNYSCTILSGYGSGTTSFRYSTTNSAYLEWYGYPPSATSTFGTQIINIMNYANTNVYKTYVARPGNAATGTDAIVAMWRSTSAITSLKYISSASAGNFQIGTTATLYGIKAA